MEVNSFFVNCSNILGKIGATAIETGRVCRNHIIQYTI